LLDKGYRPLHVPHANENRYKVTGIKQAVYRVDIDKISGWRLHVQYIKGQIHLKDVIAGKRHDDVIEVIKSKKDRYE
jgi:hypothetical protein